MDTRREMCLSSELCYAGPFSVEPCSWPCLQPGSRVQGPAPKPKWSLSCLRLSGSPVYLFEVGCIRTRLRVQRRLAGRSPEQNCCPAMVTLLHTATPLSSPLTPSRLPSPHLGPLWTLLSLSLLRQRPTYGLPCLPARHVARGIAHGICVLARSPAAFRAAC